MGNFSHPHDIFYPNGTQVLTVTSATGNSTTLFGTQTRAINVLVAGATSSNALVFVKFGNVAEAPQATSTTDMPIPVNTPRDIKVYPGQRASLISGDATASYRCYITEWSD
jgi:hypothetical protein